jgi:hypothetical protein
LAEHSLTSQCDIARGAHLPLSLSTSQKATFSQFYLAYRASDRHPDDTVSIAWANWVYKNLNDGKTNPGKNNPLEGEYSLQLMYDWSSYRLVTIIAIPLLLSLAIGGWYMNGQGDVVTAWTLALYIVTAAAGKFRNVEVHPVLTIGSWNWTSGHHWNPERYLMKV